MVMTTVVTIGRIGGMIISIPIDQDVEDVK
jgi:hypothetical protein